MQKIYILLSIFIILAPSCNKISLGQKDLVWQKRFIEKNDAVLSSQPVFWKNQVFMFRDVVDNTSDETRLFALDKHNGSEIWSWRDIQYELANGIQVPYNFDMMLVSNNILIGSDTRDLFGFDTSTGESLWSYTFDDRIKIDDALVDDKLLFLCDKSDNANVLLCYEIDPESGVLKELLRFGNLLPGYSVSHSAYCFYKNSEGDRCIVLMGYHESLSGLPRRTRLYSFNLDKGSKNFAVELENETSFSKMIVNEHGIFAVGNMLSHFNRESGENVYSLKFSNHVLEEDCYFDFPYAYLMVNGEVLFKKFNLLSGEYLWQTSLNGFQAHNICHFEDRLFLGGRNGKIYVVSEVDGNLLGFKASPNFDPIDNPNMVFDHKPSIDPETGFLYIIDLETAYCFDANELQIE